MRSMPRSDLSAVDHTSEAAINRRQTNGSLACKPYLSIVELSQLTPWTDQAIRTMMSKGVFREGVHFFHVGRRPVFKWQAIVLFIEQPNLLKQYAVEHSGARLEPISH